MGRDGIETLRDSADRIVNIVSKPVSETILFTNLLKVLPNIAVQHSRALAIEGVHRPTPRRLIMSHILQKSPVGSLVPGIQLMTQILQAGRPMAVMCVGSTYLQSGVEVVLGTMVFTL